MKYNLDELTLIWLASFDGLDYEKQEELYGLLKGEKSYLKAITENRDKIVKSIGEEVYEKIKASSNAEYLKEHLTYLETEGITAITKESTDYPTELRYIDAPPMVLYCKGNTGLLKEEKFAVVGSRKTLPFIKKEIGVYTEELIEAGFTVVTGICYGGDEYALKAGLDSGKIISVIAGGFNEVYPKENEGLMEEVASKGLIISESLPFVAPKPFFFPIRNRIIAGLAKGVLVASGNMKSGTLSTANHALRYGRDVFAFPYNNNVDSGKGCNYLISEGAKIVTGIDSILVEYGLMKKQSEEIELTDEEREVYEIIAEEDAHINKICLITGKQAYMLMPILSSLEIKKLIVKNSGNVFSAL